MRSALRVPVLLADGREIAGPACCRNTRKRDDKQREQGETDYRMACGHDQVPGEFTAF
jgi:hypothetical protein